MVLHRIKGSVCYNEMIHQEHSKILQQILQFSGHGHVLPGGAVQPAGMIMCQNDPFKSAAHTKLRHLSGSHRHLGQRTAAQLLAADQSVGCIQIEQQKAFLRASQQPCAQVLSTLDGGGQHRPPVFPQTLAAALADCGNHLEHPRGIFSHTVHLHQLRHAGLQHPVQTAKPPDQLVCQGVCILLRNGVKQKQLEKGVLLKALEAHRVKPLFQALAMARVKILFFLRDSALPPSADSALQNRTGML